MAAASSVQEDRGNVISSEHGEVRLISIPIEQLAATLIKKRRQWREAKSEYGKAGQHVSALKDEMDAIIDEMERREDTDNELPFSD